MKKYIIGRDDFTLTIFAPVNCKNNCPFCTTKTDYTKFFPNFDNIKKSLKRLVPISDLIKNIVITGGEPFNDIETLESLIKYLYKNLPNSHPFEKRKIYINTNFPKKAKIDFINKLFKINLINGLNISRHISYDFNDASLHHLKDIKGYNIRINCVLSGHETEKQILQFVQKYHKYGRINFRANYKYIDFNNLRTFTDSNFIKLDKVLGYQGISSGCHVCNNDTFGQFTVYHRGINNTSIEFNKYIEVNDLVIKQDGTLLYDWDRKYVLTNEIINSLAQKYRHININGMDLIMSKNDYVDFRHGAKLDTDGNIIKKEDILCYPVSSCSLNVSGCGIPQNVSSCGSSGCSPERHTWC